MYFYDDKTTGVVDPRKLRDEKNSQLSQPPPPRSDVYLKYDNKNFKVLVIAMAGKFLFIEFK